MAFANLFSGLSAMGEDVRSPGGSYVTSSNRTENGSRGRKRKTQREQPGSHKKRCHQIQTEDNFTSRNKSCQKQKDMHQGKKIKKKYQQRHNRGAKPVSKTQEKPKFMTQEFKDQNALLVDGRLLCRHFLSGRCIKVCFIKPQSFPCKFFHRKGKCLLEGNCRFSHEPLNDITEKLLDEAIKQEKYFYELANKNKEESSEQQANTEETKPAEEQKNPDLLTQPLRPSFYNSTDAEKEPHEHHDVTEQRELDADQPHSSSVNTQNQQEPVCYSVEAVLGPQLSRTFFSFSKTLVSQGSSSVCDPHTSSDRAYANQSKFPYSVEAVCGSYTSADDSTKGQTPDLHREQTALYAQRVISEKIKVPFRKEKPPPNICIVDKGSKETMPKSLLSPEEKDGLNSDSTPVLSHTSEEVLEEQKTHTKQELLYPEKSASSRSREIKRSLAGTKCHEGSACPPKHPTQLKPNLSKGRVAVPVEPVTTCNRRRDADDDDDAVHHFELSEIFPNSKQKQSNVHTGSDSSTAAMKPQQSEDVRIPSLPFFSLFAAPLSENPPRFPCSQTQTADSSAPLCKPQSAENAASNSKQRVSDRRFFPSQVRTSHRQTSSESFQSSKTENDALKPPSAIVCNMASGSPCDPSSSRTNQNLPDVSSSREASAPSVLKSLFMQLTPYQEDGGQVIGQSRVQSAKLRSKALRGFSRLVLLELNTQSTQKAASLLRQPSIHPASITIQSCGSSQKPGSWTYAAFHAHR
ncbi:hypothetical protein CRENBAI_009750 [Crenichthys baileyi]|uniref:C3H1-type domain-containing protein n=1 Tax=Crenichthys baileyi TaxID=28760 RepID=A0AAV9R1X3_9TELE